MRIGFLGYDRTQTSLIGQMEPRHSVEQTSERVDDLSAFDLVISFGYRHILPQSVLGTAKRPVVNLHISYLPYNRGAHPNFWSWIEGTPCGVTVHEIDPGIDTGPIISQGTLDLEATGLTFRETYAMLFSEMERLFLQDAERILGGQYEAKPQISRGTYHNAADLPSWVDWDMRINDAVARYNSAPVT